MILPKNILESEEILSYLWKRNIYNQYKKSKSYVLMWIWGWTDFKERHPKWSNIRSFRVNKQFRAFWSFDKDWDFLVFEINDHQ